VLTFSNSDESNQLELENSDKSDAADLVLRNVSLSITPGEKIAICGRSGR
jgi:ABC-type multidrug transport system fused ATPase/permease subunit